jgi:hypothetical protein
MLGEGSIQSRSLFLRGYSQVGEQRQTLNEGILHKGRQGFLVGTKDSHYLIISSIGAPLAYHILVL